MRLSDLYPNTPWPLWLMRQAGRILPQYRALRAQAPSFWELCSDPDKVVLITQQPLDELSLDAAILFSDILVPLVCFNDISVGFVQKSQPHVRRSTSWDQLSNSIALPPEIAVPFVTQAITLLRKQLQCPLIAFAGTPWTTSLYIQPSDAQITIPQMAQSVATQQAAPFSCWLQRLTDTLIEYLIAQRRAGAQQLMLFDSWAALCPLELRQQFVVSPIRRIAQSLKTFDPTCPLIYYGRGVLPDLIPDLIDVIDVFALSADASLGQLQRQYPGTLFQGNIDPELLLTSKTEIAQGVRRWYGHLIDPAIVNLGAGLIPSTPLAHVKQLISSVREITQEQAIA